MKHRLPQASRLQPWRRSLELSLYKRRRTSGGRHHHNLALHLALEESHHRGGDLGEGDAFAYYRLDLPLGEPCAELLDIAQLPVRILLRPVAPVDADHRALLEQRQVELHLRDCAGGESDHEQPTTQAVAR